MGFDWTHYAGPIGYLVNKAEGKNTGLATNYVDPGDFFGKQAAQDVKDAGKTAQGQLNQISQQAWDRQMEGLQKALASMNNYNGILAHLNGTPGAQNYFDPNGAPGGNMSQDPRMAGRPMPPPVAPPPVGATGPATEARRGPGHF